MTETIRKKIIDKIISKIPSYIKPVDYLSSSLDIAKESVYRRLRGEMSFTLDEIIKLSHELEFSVDELIGAGNSNWLALNPEINKEPQQAFLSRMQGFKKNVDLLLSCEYPRSIIALNYLPAVFCVHFKDLFRFLYYAWVHRKHQGKTKLYYSDIVISDELESLRAELDISVRNVTNNTFVLDMNVFLAPLKEVHYFYKLGLINEEELEGIKKGFHQIIDFTEKSVRTGESNPGTKYYYYLSEFNIDSNSTYTEFGGNCISSFNFHYFNTIVISTPDVCKSHKEWLESLKKYSTLITQSNEMIQQKYFDRQREYIERVQKGDFRFL